MRNLMIAGNWKMNLGPAEAVDLVNELKNFPLTDIRNTEMLVIPSFVSLTSVAAILAGTQVLLGAQNLHHESRGAFTGETSADMLREAGCTHVLVGHSERRTYAGESNLDALAKAGRALDSGLHTILCVGENLKQRREGVHHRFVIEQVESVVSALPKLDASRISVAYEPIWAVGTGETASPKQAQEMHGIIRKRLAELLGREQAEKISILYGGSMKPDNAEALLREPDVDGGLIGGASLKAESFFELITIAEKLNS